MPLKLVKRKGSSVWHVRGTIKGRRVEESTGARDRRLAEQYRAKREADILTEITFGRAAVATFAQAAAGYVSAGGEARYVAKLIAHFKDRALRHIDQDAAEEAIEALYPEASGATINRQVFTPMTAIMRYAAGRKWCDVPTFTRREAGQARTRWLREHEAAALIQASADHIRPMVVLMLYTGARLSEAMFLEWRNVDLSRGLVVYEDTKNGDTRGVPLHPAALAALANMPWKSGRVFRDERGLPYDEQAGPHWQIRPEWRAARKAAGLGDDVTPHILRHTWASWHYAANRDVYALMKLGGWRQISMVQRYTHLNVDDLAGSIFALPGEKSGQSALVAFKSSMKTGR